MLGHKEIRTTQIYANNKNSVCNQRVRRA
jgi:site-specific recombinase XerD